MQKLPVKPNAGRHHHRRRAKATLYGTMIVFIQNGNDLCTKICKAEKIVWIEKPLS